MKSISLIISVVAVSFTLTSCFLFKGGGHSKPCPAYGFEKPVNFELDYAQQNEPIEDVLKIN